MKDSRIVTKVEPELKKRIDAVANRSMIPTPVLIRAAVSALCDHWESNGELNLPVSISSKPAPR